MFCTELGRPGAAAGFHACMSTGPSPHLKWRSAEPGSHVHFGSRWNAMFRTGFEGGVFMSGLPVPWTTSRQLLTLLASCTTTSTPHLSISQAPL